MDLDGELRAILRKKLPKDAQIDAHAKLADAGLDSLDVVEIAFDLEDKFRIQLPPLAGQIGEVTFMDLRRLVEERLAANAAAVANGNAANLAS